MGEQVGPKARRAVERDDPDRRRDVAQRDELDGCLVDTRQPVWHGLLGTDHAVHVETHVRVEVHQTRVRTQ